MAKDPWFIIIYDVRHPRRLQRLHRFLRTCAYPLQESVFAWQGPPHKLIELQQAIERRVNPKEDDVRGYRLPVHASIQLWGVNPFCEGVFDSGYPPVIHHEQPPAQLELDAVPPPFPIQASLRPHQRVPPPTN